MAKSLGGIVLPDSIQWIDQLDWTPPIQEVVRTLDGGMAIFSTTRLGGRPITLVADKEVTWISQETALAIMNLAALPGEVHILDWDGDVHNVLFRHQDEPAISFRPLWPGAPWLLGIIRLMEM